MELKNDILFRECYHWSTTITVFTVLILLYAIVFSLFLLLKLQGYLGVRIAVVLVTVIPLIWISARAPMYIAANKSSIYVKKPIGKIELSLNDVISIEKIDKQLLSGSVRMGSGGLFGYFGKFRNSAIGAYNMQITEYKNLILIRTEKDLYVFNCREIDTLIDVVNSNTQQSH